MSNEKRSEAITKALQKHVRIFSRIEKIFYGSIIITAITMAVGIIFLQSRSLQVKQEINSLNSQINEEQTAYNNAKQEVNELSNRDRITKIAQNAGLTINNSNIQREVSQ
ncbi:cell division protein FtsL [Streptococcus sp. HF-1907]|uniref:cell division protein FtsL n=1 Tax=Streptococcus sp. HF-1907 TaxID=2785793 RepID=UPI0018A0CC3E|nr:cell division protein FtsL [Streptococcus sp. HF-1907]MBF7094680.1 cell division protein FtsL [Streptococcus sp. HF-1907]